MYNINYLSLIIYIFSYRLYIYIIHLYLTKILSGASKVNVPTTGTSTPRKKENIRRKQSGKMGPQSM